MKGQHVSKKPRTTRNPVKPEDPREAVPKRPAMRVVRRVVRAPPVNVERNVPPPQPKDIDDSESWLSPEIVLQVLLIIIVGAFLGGLLARYVTRGPREVVVSKEPTGLPEDTQGTGMATGSDSGSASDATVFTGAIMTPRSCDPSRGVRTDGPDEPIFQPFGDEKYQGDLPGDVMPESYDIAMNLTGATLGPAMTVTGRVDAHLTVFQQTDRVVVMAKADTLKDTRVPMLHGAPSSCSKGRGLAVHSVSRDADFLIVRVKNPLLVGHAYTLVTVHTYQLTSGGPIRLTEKLGRMELESGKAHAAFPCYDKKGLLASMKLTLVVPGSLTPISNEELDFEDRRWKEDPRGTKPAVRRWRFLETMEMPLHKLAWAVLPPTLEAHHVVPLVVRQFAEEEDLEVKDALDRSFLFLSEYFQEQDNLYISKFDIVLASEEQDSIGFLLLKPPVTIKGTAMCKKVAKQWTAHLLPQYSQPSWLASSGVDYLCRLAFADNEGAVEAAFRPDIDKCLANAATGDIKKLLAFRTAHISLGDTLMRKAIQAHVTENLFKDASGDDDTLNIFAPVLPKEKIQALFAARFETAKLERSFGQHKKLAWKQPKANPVPVAINAVNGSLKLKTPVGFNVSFLDASKPETQLLLADNEALFANPGVMACYGLELDNRSWALVGQSMETVAPHVLNADYLLSQASKQFKDVTWPHDIAGFLWASVLLKGGDDRRWNKYGKQFVATEYHAYTMLLLTPELDKTYKKRVEEVIKKRVAAIKPATELRAPAEKTSLAVALANLACFIGSEKCAEFTAGLERLVVDGEFVKKVQAATLLAPEAVACRIASDVRDDAGVDAKMKDATLFMRLAFSACLRHGIGKAALKKIALQGLSKDLDQKLTTGVRLSSYLRDKMLAYLQKDERAPFQEEALGVTTAIKRAAKLHVLRSSREAHTVHSWVTGEPLRLKHSDALRELRRSAADEYHPVQFWVTRREG